jgi:hypothetical protein
VGRGGDEYQEEADEDRARNHGVRALASTEWIGAFCSIVPSNF